VSIVQARWLEQLTSGLDNQARGLEDQACRLEDQARGRIISTSRFKLEFITVILLHTQSIKFFVSHS